MHARAAVHVVHPDFARADAELRFRNKNVFAIGGPARRSEVVIRIFRDLLHASSIGMHDPNVLAAFAVGEESDPLAVWGELRLAVERHAAIDQLGLAAFDRERVNVAD